MVTPLKPPPGSLLLTTHEFPPYKSRAKVRAAEAKCRVRLSGHSDIRTESTVRDPNGFVYRLRRCWDCHKSWWEILP